MLTHQSYYKSELIKNLKNRIEDMKDDLVYAHSTIDHSDYKFRVGMIHGLQIALDACDDVETELNKR